MLWNDEPQPPAGRPRRPAGSPIPRGWLAAVVLALGPAASPGQPNQPPAVVVAPLTVEAAGDTFRTLPFRYSFRLGPQITDDGLPETGIWTFRWERRGPGRAVFTPGARFALPSVEVAEAGLHEFHLAVSDGELKTEVELAVYARPPAVQHWTLDGTPGPKRGAPLTFDRDPAWLPAAESPFGGALSSGVPAAGELTAMAGDAGAHREFSLAFSAWVDGTESYVFDKLSRGENPEGWRVEMASGELALTLGTASGQLRAAVPYGAPGPGWAQVVVVVADLGPSFFVDGGRLDPTVTVAGAAGAGAAASAGDPFCEANTGLEANRQPLVWTLAGALDNVLLFAHAVPAAHVANLGAARPPTAITLERQPSADFSYLGHLSTEDGSWDDCHTYRLVGGDGDGNNDAFRIEGNRLTYTPSPFWVNGQEVSARVRSTDMGGLFTEAVLTFPVMVQAGGGGFIFGGFGLGNLGDPPTDIELVYTMDRLSPFPGGPVARLTAVDETLDDTHTFDLVSGAGDADNGRFTVEGDQLLAAGRLSFGPGAAYQVRLRATDAGGRRVEVPFTLGPLELRLNEFLAENETDLRDEDGQYSDWNELHNASALPVDLEGWVLADQSIGSDFFFEVPEPGWEMPSRTLEPTTRSSARRARGASTTSCCG